MAIHKSDYRLVGDVLSIFKGGGYIYSYDQRAKVKFFLNNYRGLQTGSRVALYGNFVFDSTFCRSGLTFRANGFWVLSSAAERNIEERNFQRRKKADRPVKPGPKL